jgi:hypothetical protein
VDDVRVADAREPARFLEDAGVCVGVLLTRGLEELQRDVAVQLGVPRAEHVRRGATADRIEHDETAPARPRGFGRGEQGIRRRLDVVRRVRGDGAVKTGDAVDQAEMPDQPPFRRGGPRFRRAPVDDVAVRDRRGQVRQRAFVSPQTSISSARRTSARVTAIRAASALALPCAAAICA